MALPEMNFTSFVDRIAVSDSQELKWVAAITYAMRGTVNPFYDLIGGVGDMRPIMEVKDFRALQGQEVVFTVDRPLGGPGKQGAGTTLIGSEEAQEGATFRAKVGLLRHAVATEAVTLNQTVIGSKWDARAKPQLAEWFARRMADDVMFEMIKRKHARNTVYPNGKTSRDQLGRNDYLQLDTVSRCKEVLGSNQATPFSVTKNGKTGMIVKKYMTMGSSFAFRGLKRSNSYQNLLGVSRERGDKNELYNGGLPEWDGTLLHSYDVEDHTAFGPQGNPATARAYTGVAVATGSVASGATFDLLLGGSAAAAAKTTPLYAQYFSNAQYIGHEGEKIAAVTATERYLAIMNLTESTGGAGDAGKIGFYAYKVNNGNKLVLTKALRSAASNDGTSGAFTTIGSMTWDSGALVAAGVGNFAGLAVAHGIGSLVLEVNAKGIPFVGSWAIARDMMVTGWGNVGADGEAVHGMRINDKQDYGAKIGIGWQQVWGCRAVENANNMVNGYVYIESAYTPDGWPAID